MCFLPGRHHTAEICWRENLHMSDLEALVEAKANVIIPVTIESDDSLLTSASNRGVDVS